MLKTAFWISTVCVLSSFARPQIQQQQQQENIQPENELPEIQKKDIQISKFHVNTSIQMRYAVTKVEAHMKNPNAESCQAFFNMYIPEEAFISDFRMRIKDETFVAKVETKEQAKKIFEGSVGSSGLVSSKVEFKETNHIAFSSKVDGYDKVVFELTYEEELKRKHGNYNYKLNLQLKDQVVTDFNIKININETQELDLESIDVRRESNEIYKLSSEELVSNITTNVDFPNQATIEYSDQENSVQDWIFNVDYDVIRPEDGNEVQIGAGRFVHYFSPENLPTLAKHVIFVIDVSGSMSGRPIRQTKDALIMIFEELNPQDSFDIITFSSDATIWKPSDESLKNCIENGERSSKNCLAEMAQTKVFDLNAGGGTNINEALLEAIQLAGNTTSEKKLQKMIIFLTDGDPTEGEENLEKIKENVKRANIEHKVPIYGLAFGDGADYNFIKEISSDSGAFAKKIYEAGTSFDQLENFSNEIADPKLHNVKFEYIANGKIIPPEFLSTTKIANAFGNEEYVIVGAFEDVNIVLEEFQIQASGEGSLGNYEESLTYTLCNDYSNDTIVKETCLPDSPYLPVGQTYKQSPAEEFMERFWAFKRIKSLFDNPTDEECEKTFEFNDYNEIENINLLDNVNHGPNDYDEYNSYQTEQSSINKDENVCHKKGVSLALKYNFVTKFTSLVVESDDDYIPKERIDSDTTYHAKQVNKQVTTKYGQVVDQNDYYEYYDSGSSSYASSSNYGNHNNLVFKSGGIQHQYASTAHSSGGQYVSYSDYDYDSYDQYTTQVPGTTAPTTSTTTTTTTTPYFACKLILYEKTHFRGDFVEIEDDIDSLVSKSFDDKLASVDVEGNCCWEIFVDKNFTGESMTFRRSGRFPSAVDLRKIFQKASSVKMC